MEIRTGRECWIVRTSDAVTLDGGGGRGFVRISFERAGRPAERVEMGWVPRPRRLTPALALRFLELAGERSWRDERDGRAYRILLIDGDAHDDPEGGVDGGLLVRFRAPDGTLEGPYGTTTPLALATDEELQRLLDGCGAGARAPLSRIA